MPSKGRPTRRDTPRKNQVRKDQTREAPDSGVSRHARRSFDAVVGAGTETYDRRLHLPRILPIGPVEIADDSVAGRRAIVRRLARALRAERNRGRAGHWSSDLNRHIALAQAYAAERQLLTAARGWPLVGEKN
jgi:hypothetical protein